MSAFTLAPVESTLQTAAKLAFSKQIQNNTTKQNKWHLRNPRSCYCLSGNPSLISPFTLIYTLFSGTPASRGGPPQAVPRHSPSCSRCVSPMGPSFWPLCSRMALSALLTLRLCTRCSLDLKLSFPGRLTQLKCHLLRDAIPLPDLK